MAHSIQSLLAALAVVLFAFAGRAKGKTPPNSQPTNYVDMVVAFGNLLAMNGAGISITEAKTAPVIGLAKPQPNSSFTIFMVDLDAPNYLHWAQTGLTTSNSPVTLGGTTFYPLINAAAVTALQNYVTPGPPAGPAHRYTQYLMATTNFSDLVVSQSVATALQTRMNLNVTQLFQESGKTLAASNWWNTSRTPTGNVSSQGNGTNGTLAQAGLNGAVGSFGNVRGLVLALGIMAAFFSLL